MLGDRRLFRSTWRDRFHCSDTKRLAGDPIGPPERIIWRLVIGDGAIKNCLEFDCIRASVCRVVPDE